MLSDEQIKRVWEGLLKAEFRGYYFADLSSSSLSIDRWLNFLTLFLSAGFIASAVAKLPPNFWPIPVTLSILAGGLGMFRTSMQFYKRSVDCSELSLKWQKIARDYTLLWENVYQENAAEILRSIDAEGDQLAKPGMATGKPDEKRLQHWWDYVVDQRSAHVRAAH